MALPRRVQELAKWNLLVAVVITLTAAQAWASGPPVFEQDVLPIFASSCNHCHSGSKPAADLNLRSAKSVSQGSAKGRVVVPGASEKSFLFEKISTRAMPPEGLGKPPTKEEIDVIRRWIDGGARTAAQPGPSPAGKPRQESLGQDSVREITEADRAFWSFRKPVRPPVPRVKDRSKRRTEIDAFVLAKLDEKGLSFSPQASKAVILRRAYFDLLGLPPSPEEVRAFLADERPDAYELLIERLLSSKHYGERWARHWLDVAGYSDERGFANDLSILVLNEGIWRYRDYVIRSFNDDKPYDQFLTEQLAGDELVDWKNADEYDQRILDSLAATGYLRLMQDPTDAPEVMSEPYYYDVLTRVVDNFASGILGLTGGCARCHDHKYDPLTQRDYYRLLAVFATAYNPDHWVPPLERWLPDVAKGEKEAIEQHNREIDRSVGELNERIDKIRGPHQQTLFAEKLSRISPKPLQDDAGEAFQTALEDRSAIQKYLFNRLKDELTVTTGEIDSQLSESERKQVARLEGQVATMEGWRRSYGKIPALWDMGEPPDVHVLLRGSVENRGPKVAAGFVEVLSPPGQVRAKAPQDVPAGSSGRRLALARWLTRPEHPLTARTIVNRVWMHHFGEGIVATPGNFGRQGSPPTHPDLLDWLAVDFVENGWSIKRLHRLIMTSAAYRQSSRRPAPDEDSLAERVDPANNLLWRMNLRRAEAEVLRDGLLAASGLMTETMFGPPVLLDSSADGLVTVSDELEDPGHRWRRSIYLLTRRSYSLGFLDVFDFPIMSINCTRRTNSATPLQSLTMLNSEFVMQRSMDMAAHVIELAGSQATKEQEVEAAFLLALSRPPSSEELTWSVSHVEKQRGYLRTLRTAPAEARKRSLAALCQVLLAGNEFLYIE